MFLPRMPVGLLVLLAVALSAVAPLDAQDKPVPPVEAPATASGGNDLTEKDPAGNETTGKETTGKETTGKDPAPGPQSAPPEAPKGVPGQPAAADGPAKPDATSPEQLQEWIKDLVHQKFANRQAASQKLIQAGVPGMEAAAEAAKTEDLELATRCLAVLTEGLNSKEKAVRNSAKKALETLAKSENKSVAQRARQALEASRGLADIPGGFPQRNIRQMQVQVINGVRQITVVENGKETVIKDTNGKDITVAVTETVNGQKQTQTVTGKDEEDLKKNHPEAYALLKRYGAGNGVAGVQIQFGANPFLPGPPRPFRPRVLNPIKAGELMEEVDQLRQKLEASNERLAKAAASDKPNAADLKTISEEISSITKRLAEIKTESQLP